MNRRRRNYMLFAAYGMLILTMVWLRHGWPEAEELPWLLLPLISAGGYLEGVMGALVCGLFSAAAVVIGSAVGWIPRYAASAEILGFGLGFGLTALFAGRFETWQRSRANKLLPVETKLLQVERKGRVIRGQMEDHERRLKNLAQLYETAKKLTGVLELAPLLDEARTLVARSLPGHFGTQVGTEARLAFYIPEDVTLDLHRVESRGHEVSDEGLPELVPQADLRRWSGEALNPIRVRDLGSDVRFQSASGFLAFQCLLIIPLVIHDMLVGLMVLAAERANAFSAADFNQAGVLGKQIVLALRKALLYREVQTLSITDNLTGLFVHRYFQERFREELSRAQRYRHTLALILLDLDDFKRVNDEHGHPVGDAVLAEAAARLREAAGPAALVARYGGEEFAVLLPGTSKIRALEIADDINQGLKATPIDVGGARLTMTICGGVAVYPEDALAREALIEAADQALYAAKRNGRDQIAAYQRPA